MIEATDRRRSAEGIRMGKLIQRRGKRASGTRKQATTARRAATGKSAAAKGASPKAARRWVAKNYAKLQRLAIQNTRELTGKDRF